MPSVATWWCGEKPALDYVRENFDDLVIKPAYPSQRMDPIFGDELKGAARAEMLQRIAARPHAYVAQETGRTVAGAGLEPRARASPAGAPRRPARLCGDDARRLLGDAGRPDARRHRRQRAHHLDAARRLVARTPGC